VKIPINGVNGFIGQYAVKEALAQGIDFIAFVCSDTLENWPALPNLTVVNGDYCLQKI
jgi:hypothetical protein